MATILGGSVPGAQARAGLTAMGVRETLRAAMSCRLILLSTCAALAAGGVAVGLAQPRGPGSQATAPRAGSAPDDLSPEDVARRSKRVAKVGEVQISVGDVEDAVNSRSPFLRVRYEDPERLHDFLQQLVRFELLAAEAQRRGYATNEAVVHSVQQNAVQALIRREFDERITPESMTQADVAAYYASHASEFHRDEMIRASHILVADHARAVALVGELRDADARAFREAARQNSIDQETKLRGGDLRYFNHEGRAFNSRDASVDEAIVSAAFRLREVGDVVAEPVPVGENWSIIKLTGRRPAEDRTLEDSEQSIRMRLWREQRQQAIEAFVQGLRERYAPRVFEERMAPIRLETTPTASKRGGFPAQGGSPMGGGSAMSGAGEAAGGGTTMR